MHPCCLRRRCPTLRAPRPTWQGTASPQRCACLPTRLPRAPSRQPLALPPGCWLPAVQPPCRPQPICTIAHLHCCNLTPLCSPPGHRAISCSCFPETTCEATVPLQLRHQCTGAAPGLRSSSKRGGTALEVPVPLATAPFPGPAKKLQVPPEARGRCRWLCQHAPVSSAVRGRGRQQRASALEQLPLISVPLPLPWAAGPAVMRRQALQAPS